MQLSLYDDKDFASKQDDYINERIKNQNDDISQKELKESMNKKPSEKNIGRKPDKNSQKDPSKIK